MKEEGYKGKTLPTAVDRVFPLALCCRPGWSDPHRAVEGLFGIQIAPPPVYPLPSLKPRWMSLLFP